MPERKLLLDLNVLIALGHVDHDHHRLVLRWFNAEEIKSWGTCLLTQSGFIRVMSNARARGYSISEANVLLALLMEHEKHRFWPTAVGWNALTAPFSDRIFGHQQVTDACLLGLAVREGGILVTMDKGIGYLAGSKYSKNLLLLDPD